MVGVFLFRHVWKFTIRGHFFTVRHMSVDQRVTAVVVNYQTPDLLETAVRSFHEQYPDVRLLIVDNGSKDESRSVIETLAAQLGTSIEPIFLDENRYHGPAMDLGIRKAQTPLVYIFDSDTETKKGGFLEEMSRLLVPDDAYGSGKIARVNKRGFAADDGTPVLVSAHMLLQREIYLALPPFVHHGLPALDNFRAAAEKGYRLAPFPIDEYVEHFGRGTAERFGYGLGLKSRLDYLLNKLGL